MVCMFVETQDRIDERRGQHAWGIGVMHRGQLPPTITVTVVLRTSPSACHPGTRRCHLHALTYISA
jgi:hypothetical protein